MRVGRPSKYKKDFHKDDFIRLSKQGKSLSQIAYAWDVDRDTVYEWTNRHPDFSDAVKRGRQYAEAWYMDLGQAAMVGQAKIGGETIHINLGMFCWLTKNMFKWTDKVEVSDNTQQLSRPLRELTDEELDEL